MDRRKFLRYSGVVSASTLTGGRLGAAESWGFGDIGHLIPLASHDTILLKVSFADARQNPVLRTAPAPDTPAERFRMLVYTCAGGPDDAVAPNGVWRYLPEANRPAHLAGSRGDGYSESYGSYRWGNLLELLLYDCRRFISVAGPTSVFVERQAERWMTGRAADEAAARHLIHIPSTPMGWTAGKWGDWMFLPRGRLNRPPLPSPWNGTFPRNGGQCSDSAVWKMS